MSGGYFEYKDEELKYSLFGWTDKYKNILEDREISELVWDVLTLLHEYDWYKSGDNGRDDYLEAKRNFKKKWFAHDTVSNRRKYYIDGVLAEAKQELYDTFDIEVDKTDENERNERKDMT